MFSTTRFAEIIFVFLIIIEEIFLLSKNNEKERKFEDVLDNEFPFMVLLVKFHFDENTTNNEEKCTIALVRGSTGVLINKNTILGNYDVLDNQFQEFIDPKKNSKDIFSDIYVLYGGDFGKYMGKGCDKIKRDGVKIISYKKYSIDEHKRTAGLEPFTPLFLGFLDKDLYENGNNIMYIDLYEGEKELKGDFMLICTNWIRLIGGVNKNTTAIITHNYQNFILGFTKIKYFPSLDCEKGCIDKSRESEFSFLSSQCISGKEGCVGPIDSLIGNSFYQTRNKYGCVLVWKKKKHENDRLVYYGNPLHFLRPKIGVKNFTTYEEGKLVEIDVYAEVTFSNIYFDQISYYVDWIWNSVIKPGGYRPPYYRRRSIIVPLCVLFILILLGIFGLISLLVFCLCLRKKNLETEKEIIANKAKQLLLSKKTVDIMHRYTKLPKWMERDGK